MWVVWLAIGVGVFVIFGLGFWAGFEEGEKSEAARKNLEEKAAASYDHGQRLIF